MSEQRNVAPDSTAVRVGLWRAMHVQIDPPPHVLEDELALQLADPDESWRQRPDMDPVGTRLFRASIVARARFIEDLVVEQAADGLKQYVILGAGLETFAQRRPEIASHMNIFEIDRPAPQRWKRQRLIELGWGIPERLRFVPVDFEAGEDWWNQLADAGFKTGQPAVVASSGVSMYLTNEAILATLRQVASLAMGSTLVMSFLLPLEFADSEIRPWLQRAVAGAQASGTPFLSFFMPAEILAMASAAGFREVEHVSASSLTERYFSKRTDGLRLANHSEELLIART